MADIFVSYTSSDRAWADWIGRELVKLGHTPHIDAWEIKPGESIYAWMEKRHDEADHVLCVLSDEYLDRVKAPFSAVERDAALWQAASKRPGFVLLVAVKPFRLPALADHMLRCELFNIPESQARSRFCEFMEKREPHGSFPGRVFAASNIPIRVPAHFKGRDDVLAAIRTEIHRSGRGGAAITALHGLAGVGKTTLVAAYAKRHRADYRATWWIRAQTEATIRADLVALGVRLGWVAADAEEEAALAAVQGRLHDEGEGILLIYDNAIDQESIDPYLPLGGEARAIVTSKSSDFRRIATPVEIEVWPKEIGADYLIARTGREKERKAALALSAALGGLPLAHEQAAAYCERLGRSLGEYGKRFKIAPIDLLDGTRDAAHDYGLTVSKTFALAIEGAAKVHPGAAPLIEHAALLAPEPIPLFLFAKARKEFAEPFAAAVAGDGLDEAVAALRGFALIDREDIADERKPAFKTKCIRLHRLVREVAAARRDDKAREDARRALVQAVALVYPKKINEPETWPRARRLDAIALALIEPKSGPLDSLDEPVAEILTGLGLYRLLALAAYEEAKSQFERALTIREAISKGPEDVETAHCRYNLAEALSELGKRPAARRLYERALAVHEKVNGPNHRETACCLSSLGMLLNEQKKFPVAHPLLARALAISEKNLGRGHPEVATDLSNLGRLLFDQGKLKQARPLYERALAIVERKLGRRHLTTATHLFNLADLRWHQGERTDAYQTFLRALAIDEKELGLEHPSTKQDAEYVVKVLDKGGWTAKAGALREKYRIKARRSRSRARLKQRSGETRQAARTGLREDERGRRPRRKTWMPGSSPGMTHWRGRAKRA